MDDFVDMQPNRSTNYCCGAGGGNWPLPCEDDPALRGRFKYSWIGQNGADVVVVGCSNCHDRMMKRLPKFYRGATYEVKYIRELVADTLVFEPWSEEEIAGGQAESRAHWESPGVNLDDMEF